MSSPVGVYEITMVFPVPLPFAYRWCTDYSPEDRELEGDLGSRIILRKGRRKVVYEDLNETSHGWMWSRQTVTLDPPDRWHAVAHGNYRIWRKLDYQLRALPGNRTEFHLRGERVATPLGGRNPSKAALEKELREMWQNLSRNMARDYRRTRRPPRSPRG